MKLSEETMYSDNLKIFSGSSTPKLTERICKELGKPLGQIKLSRFKSGEIYCLYEESVRNCDVFLVQTLSHPINEHLMELLVMMDAAKRGFCRNYQLCPAVLWLFSPRAQSRSAGTYFRQAGGGFIQCSRCYPRS